MRKVILYIAMSLDGYIADKRGDVQWLAGDGTAPENQGSYPRFYETIDTVVLGYTTYHQIKTELSPDKWMYEGKQSVVLTHREKTSTKEIVFTDESIADLINRLKAQSGKDIWICGGASIVNQLIKLYLIDRYHITVIPTVLGGGIPLFEQLETEIKLRLVKTEEYNGMVDLVYEPRI